MGAWLARSLVVLRRLDSTKASYWRLTLSTITPVPRKILPALVTGSACKVTSWRE